MSFTIHFCQKPKSAGSEPYCFSSPDLDVEELFQARAVALDAGPKVGADWIMLTDKAGKSLETWTLKDGEWERANA